jgi:tripartite-type tricarboxylate transporter receptor subunit TctC
VTHVPYRSGGSAMQDLISGRIDYQCPLMAIALPQIEGEKVKSIATLAARRSTILPQLATAGEQGLADFELSTWNALFLPKGTPGTIVRKLHDAADAAIELHDVQERLKQIAAEPVPRENRSSEYLERFVAREIGKWSVAIKAAGVTPQ